MQLYILLESVSLLQQSHKLGPVPAQALAKKKKKLQCNVLE